MESDATVCDHPMFARHTQEIRNSKLPELWVVRKMFLRLTPRYNKVCCLMTKLIVFKWKQRSVRAVGPNIIQNTDKNDSPSSKSALTPDPKYRTSAF